MSTCAVCQENQNDDLDGPADTEFAKGLREAQLTNSPLIRIVPPYLETTEGKKCFLLEYFKKVRNLGNMVIQICLAALPFL